MDTRYLLPQPQTSMNDQEQTPRIDSPTLPREPPPAYVSKLRHLRAPLIGHVPMNDEEFLQLKRISDPITIPYEPIRPIYMPLPSFTQLASWTEGVDTKHDPTDEVLRSQSGPDEAEERYVVKGDSENYGYLTEELRLVNRQAIPEELKGIECRVSTGGRLPRSVAPGTRILANTGHERGVVLALFHRVHRVHYVLCLHGYNGLFLLQTHDYAMEHLWPNSASLQEAYGSTPLYAVFRGGFETLEQRKAGFLKHLENVQFDREHRIPRMLTGPRSQFEEEDDWERKSESALYRFLSKCFAGVSHRKSLPRKA